MILCFLSYTLVGVGRIVAEAKSTPTVIPFWHVGKLPCVVIVTKLISCLSVGMDDMLPNYAPYIPRLFKVYIT